jgi:AcrR family transcriptional regulator
LTQVAGYDRRVESPPLLSAPGSVFTSAQPDFAARMAAAQGSAPTREAIVRAALALFAEQGYMGSSLRQLAERVGIEAGSLYNHFSSKADLLSDMVVYAIDEVLTAVRGVVQMAPYAPSDRLRAAVAAHITFHCTQREQVIVLDREFRLLPPESAVGVAEARIRYESVFSDILDQGVATGAFREHNTSLSSKAILRLGPGTALWFQPGGTATAAEIGSFYADLFVRALVR